MRHLTIPALIAAICLSAAPAAAVVRTIERTGSVVFQVPLHPIYNPAGATSVPGVSVGSAISFSATYDDADLFDPSGVTTFAGEVVSGPNFRAVSLGNGNPVNAATLTVGSQSFDLSNQLCFEDPVCSAQVGQEFSAGPTLLFDGTTFLGMDSCLIGETAAVCQLVLDQLAPLVSGWNTELLGYTRSDLFFINDTDFNTVFIGQFDGPGVSALSPAPEPATWGMMILGFGVVGGAMRRRLRTAALA